MEYKEKFVEEYLKPLLIATGDFEDATYERNVYGEEYVTVTWRGGHEMPVCVSCDSEMAMAFDVIKSIMEDY
jgi:hypothetical protein